jgi:hypothetical protein
MAIRQTEPRKIDFIALRTHRKLTPVFPFLSRCPAGGGRAKREPGNEESVTGKATKTGS